MRAYWLTNRDYAQDEVGRFFYIDEHGDEPAINVGYLESRFGTPDAFFKKSGEQEYAREALGLSAHQIAARIADALRQS